MDEYRSLDEQDVAEWAEAALTRAFAETVSLSSLERISREDRRNLVLRAQARFGGTARPVIIKLPRAAGYRAMSFAESGLIKEWVARNVLGHSPSDPHSSWLAGDAEKGLIVFDDFGAELPSLVNALLEGTPDEAEAALADYAVAMARLHAATMGCRQRHGESLAAAFPNAAKPRLLGADWLERAMPHLAGQALPANELETLRARLADPGPWLALVHADGCPDNVLLDDGQARLIDFEFSAPGHMLLDAVYWRLGFPSCWCAGVVPEDVADRIEVLYRRELAGVLSLVADDDAFAREITTVMVARTLFSLSWMLDEALVADKVWGRSTRRSRILWYLQAAIAACQRTKLFPKLEAVLAAWLAHLHQAWVGIAPLPVYPAFKA